MKIKNWSKHQHFKDRRPPWIKLHREMLDDPDWHKLSGDEAKTLLGMLLIASEDESKEGGLPESRLLAFRLRITERQLNQNVINLSKWLIQDDINVISTRYQADITEIEHKEPVVRPPALPSKFHLFWEIWPLSQRKVSKTKCEAVWLKNNLDKISQQIIIDVERKSKTKQWLDGYEPAPLTYLNQKRWEDGVAPDRVEKPEQKSGVSKYLENFKDKEFKNEPIDVTPTTTRVDQESLCEIECDIWPGFNENDLG